jgi:hypothetical protein
MTMGGDGAGLAIAGVDPMCQRFEQVVGQRVAAEGRSDRVQLRGSRRWEPWLQVPTASRGNSDGRREPDLTATRLAGPDRCARLDPRRSDHQTMLATVALTLAGLPSPGNLLPLPRRPRPRRRRRGYRRAPSSAGSRAAPALPARAGTVTWMCNRRIDDYNAAVESVADR